MKKEWFISSISRCFNVMDNYDNSDNLKRFDSVEEYNENFEKQIFKRRILCLAGLAALAILLVFLRFRPPLVSSMFAIDLSILPELITAIAFGPIAGVTVCFIKFFIHIAFIPTSLIPDIANFFIESVFIVFAEVFYSSHMYMADDENIVYKRFEREKAILRGSLLAMIPTFILQFLLTEFFVFPKLEKHYAKQGITYDSIIANYNITPEALRNHFPGIAKHIPDIKGIWMGILTVNIPITFIKLLLVTLITIIVYKYISPFLHYRRIE